ncbi:PREDICTED: prolyl 3-hydroxylase 1-like isoform X2 [Amphimedon queenslandica]|uniref:Leprecan-like alpha-helical domain-containing protein n=1 Tax=Amphimedon queenslandica TaxID=400682 RepID=A0AAN0JUT0_AMPQE|nr:PREDICTED: prolyl 3-hydroxylase 1-like isoform X2 [Amphimedon queenslandica]|eukprot:XP_019860815.1 PREDICTED: prolyl 3-hydroxylase 1-like isoform X2 [Amphimedon queenslandica]
MNAMMLLQQLVVFLLFSVLSVSAIGSYQVLYAEGTSAYYEEDWRTAVDKLERALADYNEVKKAKETCYKECSDERASIPGDYVDDEQLHFFHALLERSSCRKKCNKKLMGEEYNLSEKVSKKINEVMSSGEIHIFIQYSLYNLNNVTGGAAHAATHLYLSPGSSPARANMEYYQSLKELSESDFKPLYSKAYRDLYVEGQALYNSDEYEKMVDKVEEALLEYYIEIEKCRLECEGPQEFNGSKFFAEAMWSHHHSYLQCQYDCPEKLGDFRDDDTHRVNFLGSFYHYLTYGYFNIKRMKDAAKAVMTHLRIEPNSKIAVMNKGYIKQQPGITIKDFVEREDAKSLLDRMEKEKKVLDMLERLSKRDIADVPVSEEDKNDEELLEEDFNKFPVIKEEEFEMKEEKVSEEKPAEKEESKEDDTKNKVVVLETAADHGGVHRVLLDNLITQEQCQSFLELTKNCVEGDGYQRKSPHTPHEKFEGLHVLDAAKGAVRKTIKKELAQLYLDASELVRSALVEQFNLSRPLFFSYTHLVCRTGLLSMCIIKLF